VKKRKHIYAGYELTNLGYYSPDHCIWWEAVSLTTGEADYHAHTMRELKALIKKGGEG